MNINSDKYFFLIIFSARLDSAHMCECVGERRRAWSCLSSVLYCI
jgi:hypothetical protein